MKKLLSLSLVLMLAFSVSAQQVIRIAIIETQDEENKVSAAIESMVRSNLTKVISGSPGYEGYDRVSISEIMDEHDFERTGMVDDEQIKRLGALAGADFLLVSQVYMFNETTLFVDAKLLDVETAKTERSENRLMSMTPQDIQSGCEILAYRLLGIPLPSYLASNDEEALDAKKPALKKKNGKSEPVTQKDSDYMPLSVPGVNTMTKIGDIKIFPDGTRGVVFYYDVLQKKFLAVSLEESEEVWDKTKRVEDISGLENIQGDEKIIECEKGSILTQTIIYALGSNASAAYWCSKLGDGWYLPSCGELYTLMQVVNQKNSIVARKLKDSGGGSLSGWYWTSTEHDKKEAFNVHNGGRISTEKKTNKTNVRAIRSFTE